MDDNRSEDLQHEEHWKTPWKRKLRRQQSTNQKTKKNEKIMDKINGNELMPNSESIGRKRLAEWSTQE